MKCPYCQEDLGLNDICINPACSYFGTAINFSEKSNVGDTDNNNSTINTNLKYNSNDRNNHDINPHFKTVSEYNTFIEPFNISTEEFTAFIGSHNTDYYLNYIDKIKKNNIFLSWNWPCFLLSFYWLLYRKLYKLGCILIILSFIFSNLFKFKLSIFLILILHIILGIFGNCIYLNNAKKRIKLLKINIGSLTSTQYMNKLCKKGGVNLFAPLIALSIYIFLIIISLIIFLLFASTVTPINFNTPVYHY